MNCPERGFKLTREELRHALKLYAVTDKRWLKDGETLPDILDSVLQNGVTMVQLREKHSDFSAFMQEAASVLEICRAYHVPCIINDNVEIALSVHADGVHVGQDDLNGRDIRALIGPDRILGITARSVSEAKTAASLGADYLGVGAVFGTSTKMDARALSLDAFHEIANAVPIPVVAIGGICAGNISRLKNSGAAGVAVVSGIFASDDPGAETRKLLSLAQKYLNGGVLT